MPENIHVFVAAATHILRLAPALLLAAALVTTGAPDALADSIRIEIENLRYDMKAGRHVEILCALGGRAAYANRRYAPISAAQGDNTADRPTAYLSAVISSATQELHILTPDGLHVWPQQACRLIRPNQG